MLGLAGKNFRVRSWEGLSQIQRFGFQPGNPALRLVRWSPAIGWKGDERWVAKSLEGAKWKGLAIP